MRVISLSNGGETLVSDEDFQFLNQWKWRRNTNGYVVRTVWKGKLLMHRLITSCPAGLEVDHINRDRLDNRRENLRNVTHAVNQRNTGTPSNNRSGVKGVCWDKARGKWRASTRHKGKDILIGRFDAKRDAAAAYEKWVETQIPELIGRAILASMEARQ